MAQGRGAAETMNKDAKLREARGGVAKVLSDLEALLAEPACLLPRPEWAEHVRRLRKAREVLDALAERRR